MSDDLQTRTTSPQPSSPPARAGGRLDLSVSKVVGGALAAMTAAGLGSRLSVAGTLIGAALASVIAAVAGAFYTASLDRTRQKVRTVWTGRVAGSDVPTSVDAVNSSTRTATGWASAEPTATQSVTGTTWGGRPPEPPRRRLNWKGIVVGAIAIFAIAAAALTGFELISGHALSGGQGTTITQVSEAKSTKQSPTPKPTPSATPSATAEPSATSSPEPTAAESSAPEPSSAPTSASASAPPTPSASQTPSAATSQATPVPSGSAS